MKCESCVYFIAHDAYDYFGVCERNEKVVIANYKCEEFKKIQIEEIKKVIKEKGKVYCLSCKKPIYSVDELKEHLKGRIFMDIFCDEVAAEESPTAD